MMVSKTEHIDYSATGFFSKLVTDYISGHPDLRPFYEHPVTQEGIRTSIYNRRHFHTDRKLLHDVMMKQYCDVGLSKRQKEYVEKILDEDTFTVTTAHQPNLFTGPLYFLYKIIHVIKLADQLKKDMPELNFVPVYYMGSEDADLDELGHFYINGERKEWDTHQQGAVGRMKIDNGIVGLIDSVEGQLTVSPYGTEIISLLRKFYTPGRSIAEATFLLVNALFAGYGLIILLPDEPLLKKAFSSILEKELMEQFSHPEVVKTVNAIPGAYKVKSSGRELNLFYLQDDFRERIETDNEIWKVQHTGIGFDSQEVLEELEKYPERFSPNVILRPVFQEFILPNIIFVGGGGEIAYWLTLRNVFEAAGVPYPVLMLRNSFLLICNEQDIIIRKLQLLAEDIFKNENDLFRQVVKERSDHLLSLKEEIISLQNLYAAISAKATVADVTLQQHVEALLCKAVKKLELLEKKMIRATKKRFSAEERQLRKLKKHLFPNENLQERVDNFIPYYARNGKSFIDMLYANSPAFGTQFTIVRQNCKCD